MDSGIKGVCWNKKNNKWIVKVTIDGKRVYLGSFDTLQESKTILIKNNIPIVSNEHNSKYSVDRNYFKEIDSPEKAFWLGFICADGSVKKMRNVHYFKITQSDNTLLEKMKEDLSYTGRVVLNSKKQNGRYSDSPFYELTIYDKEFAESLINVGKTKLKHDLKIIPKSIPELLIVDFIRGYFEGDGSVCLNNSNKNWKITISGNLEFLENIKKHIKVGGIYKDKSISSYVIGGNNQVKDFFKLLYYDKNVYGLKISKYGDGDTG